MTDKTYNAFRRINGKEFGFFVKGDDVPVWYSSSEIKAMADANSPELPDRLAVFTNEETYRLLDQYEDIWFTPVGEQPKEPIEYATPKQVSGNQQQQQQQQQQSQQPQGQQGNRHWNQRRQQMNRQKQPQKQKDDTPSDWLEHLPTVFLWLLLFLLLLGIGAAIAWNVQPFIEMTSLIAKSVDQGAVESFLGKIPVIGDLLLWIGGGIIVITGSVWFIISQALELAPTLMTSSDKHTLRMINAITQSVGLEVHQSDHTDLVWLKNTYNNRLIASVSFFRTCRTVVLTMEAAICWITHPPVAGSPLDFILYLCTGQFDKINWGNVALTISLLFLIECLVKISLKTLKHIQGFE